MGVKIRTMWMTPFYLFMGVLLIYMLKKSIILKKLKYFFLIFLILFILSPVTYLCVSIFQTDKRTDYPGKEIAQVVDKQWKNNFINHIGLVGGDEWHAGNLSYHLSTRPIWDNILESKKITLPKNNEDGFVLVGNSDTLIKICNGIFLQTSDLGICMIGKKKSK